MSVKKSYVSPCMWTNWSSIRAWRCNWSQQNYLFVILISINLSVLSVVFICVFSLIFLFVTYLKKLGTSFTAVGSLSSNSWHCTGSLESVSPLNEITPAMINQKVIFFSCWQLFELSNVTRELDWCVCVLFIDAQLHTFADCWSISFYDLNMCKLKTIS